MTGALQNSCPVPTPGSATLLFAGLIRSLMAAQCELGNPSDYPPDYGDVIENCEEFDFIVVGCGSAGSAVASRLSENPNWSVLALDAGDDPPPATDVPAFFHNNLLTDIDWQFRSEPDNVTALSIKNRDIYMPRGKVLGGSSTINLMLFVRGNKADYDEWASYGNCGWSYDDVLPYFKTLENYGIDDEYHSSSGPVTIENYSSDPYLDKIEKAICDGFNENGVPLNSDFSADSQIGCGKVRGTLINGTRANTAKMYFKIAKNRKNLKVVKNALVYKVLLRGKTAYGVLYSRKGKIIEVKARKEVILSAGVFGSPQILMLSGIGPRNELMNVGVAVRHHLPGVGKNLQDHPTLYGMSYIINREEIAPGTARSINEELFHYLNSKRGIFAGIGTGKLLAFKDTLNNSNIPDVQFIMLMIPKGKGAFANLVKADDYVDEVSKQFLSLSSEGDVIIPLPIYLREKSRGEVVLRSNKAEDYPIIRMNFFSQPEDVDGMIRAMDLAEAVMNSESVVGTLGAKPTPIRVAACSGIDERKDFQECYLRHLGLSIYHPVGTCKMGPSTDTEAVVDNKLKVNGIHRLRVVDSSIMPTIPRGNTNIPTIMIAEKASDLIKKDWTVQ